MHCSKHTADKETIAEGTQQRAHSSARQQFQQTGGDRLADPGVPLLQAHQMLLFKQNRAKKEWNIQQQTQWNSTEKSTARSSSVTDQTASQISSAIARTN